jgi:hypothetical protein
MSHLSPHKYEDKNPVQRVDTILSTITSGWILRISPAKLQSQRSFSIEDCQDKEGTSTGIGQPRHTEARYLKVVPLTLLPGNPPSKKVGKKIGMKMEGPRIPFGAPGP